MWTNSEHPLIKAIVKILPIETFTDIGTCAMLTREDDVYTCLIHKYLGHESKPECCREYPDGEDYGGLCFGEK